MIKKGDWILNPSFDFNLLSVKESRAVGKESVFHELFNLSVNFVITYIVKKISRLVKENPPHGCVHVWVLWGERLNSAMREFS